MGLPRSVGFKPTSLSYWSPTSQCAGWRSTSVPSDATGGASCGLKPTLRKLHATKDLRTKRKRWPTPFGIDHLFLIFTVPESRVKRRNRSAQRFGINNDRDHRRHRIRRRRLGRHRRRFGHRRHHHRSRLGHRRRHHHRHRLREDELR